MSKEKEYILWLDDERSPFDQEMFEDEKRVILWAKDISEFINYIESYGYPVHICFDHDLAPEHYAPREFWNEQYETWAIEQNFTEKNGMDCFLWVCKKLRTENIDESSWPQMSCHSANEARRPMMEQWFKYLKVHDNEYFDKKVSTHLVSIHSSAKEPEFNKQQAIGRTRRE